MDVGIVVEVLIFFGTVGVAILSFLGKLVLDIRRTISEMNGSIKSLFQWKTDHEKYDDMTHHHLYKEVEHLQADIEALRRA